MEKTQQERSIISLSGSRNRVSQRNPISGRWRPFLGDPCGSGKTDRNPVSQKKRLQRHNVFFFFAQNLIHFTHVLISQLLNAVLQVP